MNSFENQNWEFQYRVSVIIPVYNAEKTLAVTLESLEAQTMPQEDFEIILIDDGSSDSSPALCDAYAETHQNVRVIHQANAGVSAARNAGIDAARGKYLLYLDCDATLSPKALLNITVFFDAHYNKVDLVTYPLELCNANGESKLFWRYTKLLKQTGVYDLEKHWQIAQTTLNICVKNRRSQNEHFQQDLPKAADQLYITTVLSRLTTIGYVKSACYHYTRGTADAGQMHDLISDNPCIGSNYDNMIMAYNRILDIRQINILMSRYVQGIILYNLNWRVNDDCLLPRHLAGAAYDEAMEKLHALLNRLDSRVIMAYGHIKDVDRFYLLSLKTADRPVCRVEGGKLVLRDSHGILGVEKSISLVVRHIRLDEKKLDILAYLKAWYFAFTEETPRLFAVIEKSINPVEDDNTAESPSNSDVPVNVEERIEVPLFKSQFSWFGRKIETSRFFAFSFTKKLKRKEKLHFEVELMGGIWKTALSWSKKTLNPLQPSIGRPWIRNSKIAILLKAKEKRLVGASPKGKKLRSLRKAFYKKLWQTNKKLWFTRIMLMMAKRFKRHKVWLYADSHDSLDNGYEQFKHDLALKDRVKRYYVYPQDRPDLIEGKFSHSERSKLVPYGSLKHKLLTTQASIIMGSYSDPSSWFPFQLDEGIYFFDLCQFRFIYLQHGVMHAKIPNLYSREKLFKLDQIVVSAPFERENLMELGYRKKDILTCGMPRLDTLTREVPKERRILFAPSWRSYLVTTVDRVQTPLPLFFTSPYYQAYADFLQSTELEEFLEKNDLYMDVQLHPMFSCYENDLLPQETTRVHRIKKANPSDYMAGITDFSSFMYDFAYLDKPVISFFPDQAEFNAGLHSYHEFFLPRDKWPALIRDDVPSVIAELNRLAANGFKPDPEISERMAEFYYSREPKHRTKLVKLLKKKKQKKHPPIPISPNENPAADNAAIMEDMHKQDI